MDTQILPVVPFGKYKGQPITSLLSDVTYFEWCKKQPWFNDKYSIICNLNVNQSIQPNQNSRTPDHNRLQNLFLERENIERILKYTIKEPSKDNITISQDGSTIFEGKHNWDLIIEDYSWWIWCGCDETQDCGGCEAYEKYRKKYNIPDSGDDLICDVLYCEIKPLLGDDYPCVLRKMKSQIELTNNDINKENEATAKDYRRDGLQLFYKNKPFYDYLLRQQMKRPQYILLIKEFNSSTTTKLQLTQIFNQARIQIIFVDDLLNT